MADERDVETGKPPGQNGREPGEKRKADEAAAGGHQADAADHPRHRAVEDWRRRIDVIDDQLMKLLNSRSACAVEIGRIKRRIGMAVYQPDRETWILERVAHRNPGPLDSGAVRRVFERIIDEGRRLERLAGEVEAEESPDGPAATPDKEGE